VLGAIRPDSINLAVVVHVLGAMVLVGGVVTAATAAVVGWRDERDALLRFSYRTLLAVALPGWIVMRIGAQWAYSKEHLDDLPDDPGWIGIGFITADLGGLLLLIALVLGGIGVYRAKGAESEGGGGLLKASGVLAVVLVAIYVIAVWAMAGKPD
jgi:hypothetical protein